ncbi:MAG: pyridoxine 5'-phosphate synthase [Acidobacteriota bacterium]
MDLGIDLTCIAALRGIAGRFDPDPIEVALIATRAGADAIGVNLKLDRGSLTERDCHLLRDVVKVPFWLKISTSTDVVSFAVSLKPSTVVLLPERREDIALEDGIDVILNQTQVKRAQAMLREAGIQVVVFINPSVDQVKHCHKLDVAAVELNTYRFSETGKESDFTALHDCARLARKLGQHVSAGRGLTRAALRRISTIPEIDIAHVGRCFAARAILEGAGRATAWLKAAVEKGGKA